MDTYPKFIEVEAFTGYKGQGPKGLVKLKKFTQKETIANLSTALQISEDEARAKYKKGFRIYGKYSNRYGVTYMRSPREVLIKLQEQWG